MSPAAFHTAEVVHRADPAMYRRVFEDSAEGPMILAALEQRFCRKIWHAGGVEGARQTDHDNGQFSVINFITKQINIAHGLGDQGDDSTG